MYKFCNYFRDIFGEFNHLNFKHSKKKTVEKGYIQVDMEEAYILTVQKTRE